MSEDALDQLYDPRAIQQTFKLPPYSFRAKLHAGEFPPPDLRLGPRSPRWKSSTLRKYQDALAEKTVL
jgi:hypothetical protein